MSKPETKTSPESFASATDLFTYLKQELSDAAAKGRARSVFKTDESKKILWEAYTEDGGLEAARAYFQSEVGIVQGGGNGGDDAIKALAALSLSNRDATVQAVTSLIQYVENAKPQVDERPLMARGWAFAFPAGPTELLALEDMQARARSAIEQLEQSLDRMQNCEERQPVVFATMGCSGIGKSRLCDDGLKVFFPDSEACLLKVTYNMQGAADMEVHDPVGAFRWRIVASAPGGLSAAAKVRRLVQQAGRARLKLSREVLNDYLCTVIPDNKHILLVVDELMKLHGDLSRQQVVSECAALVSRRRRRDKLFCCLVTSFLPAPFRTLSVSGRPPLWIPQTLLSPRNSRRFLQEMLADRVGDAVLWEMIVKAGGHPRCLCVAAHSYRVRKRVPDMSDMLNEVFVSVCEPAKIVHVLQRSYSPMALNVIESDSVLAGIWESGVLLVLKDDASDEPKRNEHDHRIAVPAPAMAKILTADRLLPALQPLRAMLQHGFYHPTKDLERVALLSDFLRHRLGFNVVPPSLRVTSPPPSMHGTRRGRTQPVRFIEDWSSVRFKFDEQCELVYSIESMDILSPRDWKCQVKLQALDQKKAYVCPSPIHPGFESMYFAENSAGASILVLHQEKINSDLHAAVQGLNNAANSLRVGGWTGNFLFLVVCMEAKQASAADCGASWPLLLVTAANAHWYFTPSLSPVALALLMRHYQDQGRSSPRFVPRVGTTPLKSAGTISSSGSSGGAGQPLQPCSACGKHASKLCAGCRGVVYCSKDCQRAHWKEHKHVCKKGKKASDT